MSAFRGNVTTLLASAARTTSGNSGILNIMPLAGGGVDGAQFLLNVSSAAGTSPTLDVYLQWSPDGSVWRDFLHFAQNTTTGIQAGLWSRRDNDGTGGTGVIATGDAVLAASKVINAPINDSSFRVKWVMGGTITQFTFDLTGCFDRD